MNYLTDRRSLLLGAGAMGATGLLGLQGRPAMAQTPAKGGTFRIGIAQFDTGETLDPQLTETKFMQNLQWQLRNNLIEIGPGGTLVPELATEWSANDDLTVWSFKLREGVEFHNGKTMTSEDVIHSLNMHRGEDSYSQSKSLLTGITDIKASGPNEIVVTLNAPNASFPPIMALTNLTIVPADEDFTTGNGTGGYVLESFEPGQRSRVTRNPNYWKSDRAHFDEIELLCMKDVTARTTALRTGEIDAMNSVDPKTAGLLSRAAGIELIQTQGKVHYCFSMITTDPLFADNNVRMAMKLAIDRQEIVDKVLSGYGSIANDQPISEAYEYYNPGLEQNSYDPDKAKSLLKAAGAEGLATTLHVSDTPFAGAADAAVLYSEHAKAAGIEIDVAREPDDGYWSNIWGKKPFFASRWSGRANEDLMLTLAYSRESLGDYNATNWDNDAFNVALTAARSERDDARRKELYWECQAILSQDGGMIAPCWADFLDAKSSKVITSEEISGDWDLDGNRAGERWSFAS